jgi:transposase
VIDEAAIRLRYEAVCPLRDERGRRRFAAGEALAAGRGGILVVSRITGVARSTIGRGLVELRGGAALDLTRVRRPGGGRKALTSLDATLLEDLRRLVDPATPGDPEGPLLWTSKSLRNLAEGLQGLGHRIGHNTVATLLRGLGFSLQANRKTLEGASHPDRDAQVSAALKAGQPAISVDKKRSWWATSGTAGATIAKKANPNPVRSTTSWFQNLAARRRMELHHRAPHQRVPKLFSNGPLVE